MRIFGFVRCVDILDPSDRTTCKSETHLLLQPLRLISPGVRRTANSFHAMISRARLLAAVLVLSAISLPLAAQNMDAFFFPKIEPHAWQAVVKITTASGRIGSGIIVGKSRKGLAIILTAIPVIQGSEKQLTVGTYGGAEAIPAQLILDKWRSAELALIATRTAVPFRPSLKYGDSKAAQAETPVALLSATTFAAQDRKVGRIMQRDSETLIASLAISNADVGGALIDENNQLVGVVFSASHSGAGLCRALPIDQVRAVVDAWLRQTTLAEKWQPGTATQVEAVSNNGASTGGQWYGWVIGGVLIVGTGFAIAKSGVF